MNNIEQFEQLLSPQENANPVVKKRSPQQNIADLVQTKDVTQLNELLPKVPQQTLNSPIILLALLENFDPLVADTLFAHKINLEKIWKQNGDLIGPLPPEFIQWLPVASIGNNIIERFLEKSFDVLVKPLSPEHNIALAEFAIEVKKLRPDVFENFLKNEYCFFESITSSNTKSIAPQQWKMLCECIDESLWKKELNELCLYDNKNFEAFFAACKNIPMLNKLIKDYFERSVKEFQWLSQSMVSNTGEIQDSVLIQSLNGKEKSDAQKFLSAGLNKGWEKWKIPENLQVLLHNRDPSVLDEDHYENQGWFTQIYHANGYQSFLHMLLQSCGASGVDLLKINQHTENEVYNTLDVLDVSEFLGCSTPLEIKNLIKTFPKLVEWKDIAGNNLGMYIASQRNPNWRNNKEVLKILTKYPQFREDNPYGVSPRSFLSNRYSAEDIAAYDKSILRTEVKNIANAPKTKKVKRKM